MLGIAAELQDVPLRDASVFEQLPSGMRQSLRVGPSLRFWETFDRIHKVHVCAATFQQIRNFCSDCGVTFPVFFLFIRAALGGFLFLWLFQFPQCYFSETSTVCGISGIGCWVVFAKPEFRKILSSSANV